jgi:hypothetical protein
MYKIRVQLLRIKNLQISVLLLVFTLILTGGSLFLGVVNSPDIAKVSDEATALDESDNSVPMWTWIGMWVSEWLQNFSTEIMGAIVTFWIFDLIVNARNQKNSLILDLKSGDERIYVKALEHIRVNKWLTDGSLAKENIANADLHGQDLQSINLKGAYLRSVNFEGANVRFAELEDAVLIDANLRNADLSSADLENADLENADLRGASLGGANMNNANLTNAKFDHTTKWIRLVGDEEIAAILPNGTSWFVGMDLREFTQAKSDD